MIGYDVTLSEIEGLIDAEVPGWRVRAGRRTKKFCKDKKYEERAGIWSEVKPVYMRLQGGGKCAFCERKMESDVRGRGEQDVEHFRPKSSVREWKASAVLSAAGVRISSVTGHSGGY